MLSDRELKLLRFAFSSTKALEELQYRAKVSPMSANRIYDLVLEATGDRQEASAAKTQMLLKNMPSIERNYGNL